jgi:prolyl oligopeptidase
VQRQNERTMAALASDPRFERFRAEALRILTSSERIPAPEFRAGAVDNFWQDAQNPRGIWRTATLESFPGPKPEWQTILDVDALAQAEKANWIFKGVICLEPEERRCLVRLSNGGKDAVSIRELDARAKAFVPGGIQLPEGKQYAAWIDENTLIVGRDWGEGTRTESGYPFILKTWKRGQPLNEAREVFRGSPRDVWASPHPVRDPDGNLLATLVDRRITFFESETWWLPGDRPPVQLPFPRKVKIHGYVDGQLVFTTDEDWKSFKAGAVLAYELKSLLADPARATARRVFQPNAHQAVEEVSPTRDKLLITVYEDVKGAVDLYDLSRANWSATRLPLPKNASVDLTATSVAHNHAFINVQSFLEPTTQWLADVAAGTARKVRALPPQFDASNLEAEQFWAKSKDGTRIPYFVVRPKNLKLDGSGPTLMYGYGGFQISKPPVYLPVDGKLWLERGGVYVIANIRGGGEFGPAWHEAALREHRQRAFDDFAAVADDLIKRKITSPRRLGIYGRSNGGVLTSVSMTQRPDLMNALVVESPLVDMMRYHKLPPGASWIGEYGNPELPEDAAFIARYSAYQNLRAGVRYPKPYITTNTRDDRVHPGHARKFAARLEAMGVPHLYFENTDGGHSNDADPILNARRWALHYVYLSQQLTD